MKLIYLHQYFKFPNESGGTRSYDLASSFVREGIDVTIIASTSDEKYKTKKRWIVVEHDKIKIHYLYLPYDNKLSYVQRSLVFFKFLWFSTFRLLKLKCDIVLATSTPLTIGIPALIKKWTQNTHYIFEVRDVWPEAVIAIGAIKNRLLQYILYNLEKLIYHNAYAIIPLSADMQRSIVTRYPQFKEKANIVVENIAEINRFQISSDVIDFEKVIGFKPRFSILYAGTFGKVNGIHKLIELAEKTLAIDKHLVYFLIGSGAEKNAVIQLAKDRNVLNKNVFILDAISKDELPKWYKSVSMGASFVVNIPELWANSANKFFDTLASGKPILINYDGWQAKTISKYNVGYVLPFEITEKVSKDFVTYTKDYHLIKTQRMLAIELAKEKFSLEVASAKYFQVLNKHYV